MNNTRNTQNTDYSKYNSAPDREVKRGALNCHSDGLPKRIQPLHTLSRISKFTPLIKKFFPLTKREGNNKRKELINLSTYKPIYFQKPAFTLAESATHVAMPPAFSKAGFTLAEVLITLGIIGIVAAMTIPTLMAKLKNDRESAILKEDYSILQQMMKMANEEGAMGSITSGNNIDQMKEWFDTYFLPYIKTTSVCYNETGCWNLNVKNSNGAQYTTNKTGCGSATISFVLYNGSYVCMDDWGDFRFGVKPQGITIGILVDVNGDKQPNILGEDIFALQFYENELLPGGYHMTKEAVDKNCSKKCTDSTPICGVACTVKAQRQGFKLPVIPKK